MRSRNTVAQANTFTITIFRSQYMRLLQHSLVEFINKIRIRSNRVIGLIYSDAKYSNEHSLSHSLAFVPLQTCVFCSPFSFVFSILLFWCYKVTRSVFKNATAAERKRHRLRRCCHHHLVSFVSVRSCGSGFWHFHRHPPSLLAFDGVIMNRAA